MSMFTVPPGTCGHWKGAYAPVPTFADVKLVPKWLLTADSTLPEQPPAVLLFAAIELHKLETTSYLQHHPPCILVSNYCFSFSQNVNGLTNKITSPGWGEIETLPHVFAEAYPWSRTSFVLKFFSSSHE